jgi:membrane protease YdiL (CAAX protease family)
LRTDDRITEGRAEMVPPPAEVVNGPVGSPALAAQLSLGIPVARPITVPGLAPSPLNEMLLPNSTAGQAWIDLGVFVALIVAFEMLAGQIMAAALGIELPAEPVAPAEEAALVRRVLIPLLVTRAGFSTLVICLLLAARGASWRSVGLVRRSMVLNTLLGAASTVVMYILMVILLPVIWALWPQVTRQLQENSEFILDMLPRMSPAGLALVSLLVGTYEELVFRGYLMTRLRRATGSWALAIVLNIAVFTALHSLDQTSAALIWIALLGVMFSVTTVWRRSLVPAIVGHTLFDLSQFLLLYYQAGDAWQ